MFVLPDVTIGLLNAEPKTFEGRTPMAAADAYKLANKTKIQTETRATQFAKDQQSRKTEETKILATRKQQLQTQLNNANKSSPKVILEKILGEFCSYKRQGSLISFGLKKVLKSTDLSPKSGQAGKNSCDSLYKLYQGASEKIGDSLDLMNAGIDLTPTRRISTMDDSGSLKFNTPTLESVVRKHGGIPPEQGEQGGARVSRRVKRNKRRQTRRS
jgi:hypothetical protein